MRNEDASTNAQKQADAQAASIREMVAALLVDYDRLEELREQRQPWVAGWNMAGYMPEMEPDTFADQEDAREFLADELESRAEEEQENGNHGLAEELQDVADDIRADRSSAVVVAGFEYWIKPAEYDGLEPDEYEEWKELKEAAGDCDDYEDAERRIHEDALSVEIRSGWHSLGEEMEPEEFRILLCTGGPHVEMIGELCGGEPVRAWLVYQDWFTGKQERINHPGDQDAFLKYASCFYFGE